MNAQSILTLPRFSVALMFLMGIMGVTFPAGASPTIWTGPNTNFAQTAFTSPPQADVLVPGKVSLTRNFSHWLYNTNVDPGAGFGSPSDTEWAFGSLSNWNQLTYQSFDSFRNGDLSSVLVGTPRKPMVCHLITEDIYLAVTFNAWPHGGGFISYTRSTPAAVAPPPTPTVTITNPANNTVFSAPANVSLKASASVSSGTVTNVSYFFLGNASPIGSQPAAPFSVSAAGIGAGSYSLVAVATAAGVSATSSVVNISVVTPVTTALSPPAGDNNQFSFKYSVNPGLRYVIESSSNLLNWTPVVTNTATGNPASFTNPISGDGNFYRVGRLPNP